MADEDEAMAEMSYSAEQVQRLLTCSVCLERYTNPRILPCQHTFCRSPCLEGLVDMRSRRIKCPECRREHHVPASGAGGFPPNITIANFLDIPAQRGGPSSAADSAPNGPVCRVCEAEGDVSKCPHCEKMICAGCLASHLNQMRKDVSNYLVQIKKGIPKLSNTISGLEQKVEQIQHHCETVKSEVSEEIDKFIRELKDRQRILHSELDTLTQTEIRVLRGFQENLEVDLASMSSYCDSTETLLQQNGVSISDQDLKAIKKQCLSYIEALKKGQSPSVPHLKTVKFQSNGRMLLQSIRSFGKPTAEGGSRAASTNGTNGNAPNTNGTSTQRRRWNDTPQIDTTFFDSFQVNESPGGTPRRSLSPPATWQSPRESPAVRASRSSTDYRHYFGGNASGNERPPARISDYLASMNTDPEVVLANVNYLNDPINQRALNRTIASINAHERNGERMAALLTDHPVPGNLNNNARSVRQPPSIPAVPRPHRDPRPTEYYEIDLDGNPNQVALPEGRPQRARRGRNRRPQRPQQPTPSVGPANQDPPTLQRNVTFVRNSSAEQGDPALSEEMEFIEQATETMDTDRPVIDYEAKRTPVLTIGGERGSADGQFKLPRGLAVSPCDGSIIIADSSNHRAQVFDQHGQFIRSFGSYGDNDGEFDCLAGVAVGPNGNIVIADRYNHRVQVFRSNFSFKLKFGSEGSMDGKFNYPWGVAVDADNLIYVCDKENHRIQVFGMDGTFLRKFGSLGSDHGCFENPYYVAIGPDNNIYVSDSHNNRIQVFDRQGRFLNMIGGAGDQDGKLKHPKGLCLDQNGFIIVADSGNHRIQILRTDGTFFTKFGSKGRCEGQLRDPEGVFLTPDGKILVADKDNYRILMF